MIAGIDCGATLTKAYWRFRGADIRMSTLQYSFGRISDRMKCEGVDHLRVAGIRSNDRFFGGFKVSYLNDDPVANEIELQARGTAALLKEQGIPDTKYLIVSIGTGISYTFVDGENVRHFPFGNPLGGGAKQGLTRLIGTPAVEPWQPSAFVDEHVDLLMADVQPDLKDTPLGELVVAHFAKFHASATNGAKHGSVRNMIAVGVVRDLMMMRLMPDWNPPESAVVIGTTASTSPSLLHRLSVYGSQIGIKMIFPAHGEYALALGAYLTPEK